MMSAKKLKEVSAMVKYCSQCGRQVQRGTIYCTGCGAVIGSPPPHANPLPRDNPVFPFIGNANRSEHGRQEASFEKQGIQTVHVACKVLNIEVLSAESEKIRIEWDETSSWGLIAEQRGDCLQLDEQVYLGFHSFGDLFNINQRKELRIELPKDYNGILILETETGSISIRDITTEGRIEFKTTVGNIRAKNLKTNSYFRADTQTGGMDISYIDSAECFSVAGGIGQITMSGVRSDKIEVSSSGLVDCRYIYAETSISINGSTGEVRCSIDDVAENFTAQCQSSGGYCNLPDTSGNGPKALHVSTSLGNIDVRFRNARPRLS